VTTAVIACGTSMLGNMSARPRTEVRRSVPRLGDTWTLFPPLADPDLTPGTRLDPVWLAALDARWQALGLTGATSVVPLGDRPLDPDVLVCTDDELNANVRLRVRGRLLVLEMPLLDDPGPLVGAAAGVRTRPARLKAAGLLCGDARLHAAAAAGAASRSTRSSRPRKAPA
jgi:hypothetical protein